MPLVRGLLHLVYAATHLGAGTALAAAAGFLLNADRKRLDWRPLWLAVSAPLLLAVKGAGPNPFVSMPAVFGVLLWAAAPTAGLARRPAIAALLLATVSLFNAVDARRPQWLTGRSETSMAGLRGIVDRMASDARRGPRQRAGYAILGSGDLHSCAVSNVIAFEFGGAQPALEPVREMAFTATDELLWSRFVPGGNDREKVMSLAEMATVEADYLVVPDDATLLFLEQHRGYLLINRKVRAVREQLLRDPAWTEMGPPARYTPNETYRIYVRRRSVTSS